MKQTHVVVMLY